MIGASASAPPGLAVHRSRKLIPEFRLRRPSSPGEAAAMQGEAGDRGVFMAGGIDVVNRLKFGEPVAEVIHLGGIAELATIAETEGGVRLGSLVTHDRLETSALVRAHLPELAQIWQQVANIRIRCKATIGGNIMAGDPAYEFALAAIAARAQLHFLSRGGATRTVSASDLGQSRPYGLLTAVTFPSVARLRLAFDRSLRPAVTLTVGLDLEDGKVVSGRVAIGCAFAQPMAATLPFSGPLSPSEIAQRAAVLAHRLATSLSEPVSDGYASARYRRRMIEVLLRRKLELLEHQLK
jgi:carbon-monoxide dehydrogenase medium subunit